MKKHLLGIYEKGISNHLSWEEKFRLAKDSGFDCIELSVDGTPERMKRLYDPGFPDTLRRAMEKTGGRIESFALTANRAFPLGSEDPSVRARGLEAVQRAVRLAKDTGIRVIHIAGYDELGDRCSDRTKELFFASVRTAVRFAEESGVLLAVETMDAEFMGSCTNIRRLCEDIGSDCLRIYADIGNLTGMGQDVCSELLTGGDLIAGIHLKDARPGVMRDVPFGEGIVNFESAAAVLDRLPYGGPLIAETWSYDDERFHPYLRTISDFLRTVMNLPG